VAWAADGLDGTGVGFLDSWGMTTISGLDVKVTSHDSCHGTGHRLWVFAGG
jgi:hypothetical protein